LEAFDPIEAVLGLRLPADYKELCCAYGTGAWLRFLHVVNPLAFGAIEDYLAKVTRQLDAERVIRNRWPKQVPFPLYPEPGGLFLGGISDNGDRLYWLTEGEPQDWPIIVYESRGPQFDRFALSCCEFLLNWVTGHLKVRVFPDDFEYGATGAFTPSGVD
jgi:hypothetical protein